MGHPAFTTSPKAAPLEALAECLQLLGSRPLKLIAEAVQPAVHESIWHDTMWTFSRDADAIVDKKLIPFPSDTFQFSIANDRSKQDFHLHADVLEIYASQFAIELVYQANGEEEKLAVPSGVLIVPPGVAHRVKLGGLTFVFQIAIGGGSVHHDKIVVSPPTGTAKP